LSETGERTMSLPAGLADVTTGVAIFAWSSAPDDDFPLSGELEFRILTNQLDDGPALEAAEAFFSKAREDAGQKAELQRLAKEGKPPPPLQVPTPVASHYSWVEISTPYLRTLYLDGRGEALENHLVIEGEEPPRWDHLLGQVEKARAEGKPFLIEFPYYP